MADLLINRRVTIPDAELSVAFSRSGGPGGQNVNKVESKVELRWHPESSRALSDLDRAYLLTRLGSRLTTAGELIVTSTVTRDQIRNRADAEKKLAAMIRDGLTRPKVRRATKPTKGSQKRRIEGKKKRGQIKAGRNSRFDD